MQVQTRPQEFDVIVVGSGASGGWAAKRMSEAGLRVALVCAGRPLKDADYTEQYLRQVVDAVGAKLVVPIHWDDFTRPIAEPLVPMPRLLDDLGITMRRFMTHFGPRGVQIAFLPAFDPVPLLPRP